MCYRDKHNEVNGENNQDGTNVNYSHNYGFEGETADLQIEAVRIRQIKNFLLTLMISRGVPMLLGGDEFRRTQRGNNNDYCQDNAISWYDWRFLEQHWEIHRFTKCMIAFRKKHPVLSEEKFYSNKDIHWFGPKGGLPDWTDPKAKQLACLIHENKFDNIYLIFNAGIEAFDFYVPPAPHGGSWRLAIDTFRTAPEDRFDVGKEPVLETPKCYRIGSMSSVVLLSRSEMNR